jgi:TrmH family RNA methyltransferase
MKVGVAAITSRQNGMIKFLCKLRDRTKRNRHKMFLVEGMREISRAIAGGAPVETIFICEKFSRGSALKNLVAQATDSGIAICEVGADAFEKVSGRENCDGAIGLAKVWPTELSKIRVPPNALILVAEGIEKGGNLGALMRSAESAGVDALILCDPITDIFNPNVIRTSQGALFNLPIAIGDNPGVLDFLMANDIYVFATTPAAPNLYFNENFQPKTAIVVGSEHGGLSDFWLANDGIKKIALPQSGICDSLNVNDAATVVLYEALRQRLQNQFSS